MKFFQHTIKLDGKRLPLLHICLKCCCGEIFESIQTNPIKGLRECFKEAEKHIKTCNGYIFMQDVGMRKLSIKKIREILLNS